MSTVKVFAEYENIVLSSTLCCRSVGDCASTFVLSGRHTQLENQQQFESGRIVGSAELLRMRQMCTNNFIVGNVVVVVVVVVVNADVLISGNFHYTLLPQVFERLNTSQMQMLTMA